MIDKKVIVLHKYGSTSVSGVVKILRDRDHVYLDIGTAYSSEYKWYVYDGKVMYLDKIPADILLDNVSVLVVEGDNPTMYGTNGTITERDTYLAYSRLDKGEPKAPIDTPLNQAVDNSAIKLDIPNILKGNTTADFYRKVKRTLDEMFVCYPEEKILEGLVDDSKWIRIDSEGSFYVVGIVGEPPDYICYGVPATHDMLPPQELEPYCEWLPCGGERGYWVVFQSASTGETIRKLD